MSDDAFHREIGGDPHQPPRRAHRVHRAVAIRRIRRRACRSSSSSSARTRRPRFIVSKVIRELVERHAVRRGRRDHRVERRAHRRRGSSSRRESSAAGGPTARWPRALDSLTFRPLGLGPPPDERWVIVGYRTRRRRARSASIASSGGSSTPARHPTPRIPPHLPRRPPRSIPIAPLVRRAKKLSFNAGLWQSERRDRMCRGRRRHRGQRLDHRAVPGQRVRPRRSPSPDATTATCGCGASSSPTTTASSPRSCSCWQQLPQDGLDHRPAWQSRRADLGRRAAAAAVHAVDDLADAVLDHRLGPHAGDDRRAAEPSIAQPVATNAARRDRHRRGVLAVACRSRRSSGATTSARCTAARWSRSSIPRRTRRPTCSPPGSPTTASARSSASGARRVPAAPTCGGPTRSTACWPGPRSSLPRLPKGVGFTMSVRRATRIGASDGAPDRGHRHRRSPHVRDDPRRSPATATPICMTFCARLIEAEPARR